MLGFVLGNARKQRLWIDTVVVVHFHNVLSTSMVEALAVDRKRLEGQIHVHVVHPDDLDVSEVVDLAQQLLGLLLLMWSGSDTLYVLGQHAAVVGRHPNHELVLYASIAQPLAALGSPPCLTPLGVAGTRRDADKDLGPGRLRAQHAALVCRGRGRRGLPASARARRSTVELQHGLLLADRLAFALAVASLCIVGPPSRQGQAREADEQRKEKA
mmetsp:Transcript_150779/g.420287  ORF Transcript_150779/g.420287 Transcript_150779/m.420287 type:complete len:214 (-) Transcript_150779:54-695(-)